MRASGRKGHNQSGVDVRGRLNTFNEVRIFTILHRYPRMNLSGAIFEKDFSDNSYGFRQNRCCHDVIKRLEQYKQEGYRSILDADIRRSTITYRISLLWRGCVRKSRMDGF